MQIRDINKLPVKHRWQYREHIRLMSEMLEVSGVDWRGRNDTQVVWTYDVRVDKIILKV